MCTRYLVAAGLFVVVSCSPSGDSSSKSADSAGGADSAAATKSAATPGGVPDSSGSRPPSFQRVLVHIDCADTAAHKVVPDSFDLAEEGEAEWLLTPTSSDVRFEVEKKSGQPRWPFNNPPHGGSKGTPARSGRAGVGELGKWQYKIKVFCTPTYTIDPILIVRSGSDPNVPPGARPPAGSRP